MIHVEERLGYTNLGLKYQDYMVSSIRKVKGLRKGWGYHGALPVRVPTDYATRAWRFVFDHGNIMTPKRRHRRQYPLPIRQAAMARGEQCACARNSCLSRLSFI
jgi:hypothetical protein